LDAKSLTDPGPELKKEPRPVDRRRLALIVLIALVLRLAATLAPNFEDLMDAGHIHAWEPGNMAANLVSGRVFGSPHRAVDLCHSCL
jgi:hypothetical protein